jgi:hypothetical protein
MVYLNLEEIRSPLVAKYRLEEPRDGVDIPALVQRMVNDQSLYETLDLQVLRVKIYQSFRTVFQLQFESRSLVIDFQLIDEISNLFSLSSDLSGNVIIKLSNDWTSVVDKALHNWTCPKCEGRVCGYSHTSDECADNITGSIMNS